MTSNIRKAPGRTFVLVHGAFHGAWCWADVAQALRSDGHRVFVPTLTGLGERSHLLSCMPTLETFVEDVAQVLRYEDLDEVILVGHSFAGSVVSALADRMRERLRHLVYLDAQLLRSGESSADRSPKRVAIYTRMAMEFSGARTVPPFDPVHYGITDPQKADWLRTRLTPHPLQTYYDKLNLQHPLGNGLPTTYIACSQPFFSSTEEAREIARAQPGWAYLEIASGHNAMLLHPAELTAMLTAIE